LLSVVCCLFSQVASPRASRIAIAGSAGNSSRPCQATSPAVMANPTTHTKANAGSATSAQCPTTAQRRRSGSWRRASISASTSPTTPSALSAASAQIAHAGAGTFIQPKRPQKEA
jgi:hypothetical protein